MKNNISVMSLRAFMTLLVGLLVVIALVLAANDLRQSQIGYRSAMHLVERNQIADGCLQAVNNFAFERGRINILLRIVEPISSDNRRFIDERRLAADRYLTGVLALLPEGSNAKADEVRRAWAQVKSFRLRVEHDLLLPLFKRDPDLREQWFALGNELLFALESLLIDVSNASGNIDANFDRLSTLRVLAMQFRILVGIETTRYGAELSAAYVPKREMIDTALVFRGRSMQVWSLLEQGVEGMPDNVLADVLEKVRTNVFGHLRPLQDEIVRTAAQGKRAGVNVDDYLAASVAALDSSVELADAISRSAETYTRMLLDRARRQTTSSLAGIVAILLLSGFAALVMARRFTIPLNNVLARIDELCRIHSGPDSSGVHTHGRDELNRVLQALDMLDEAMAARLRSEQALHASERVSDIILNCIPQAIISTDIDGLIKVFSSGAERMLGYSAAEVVGKQTPLFFHEPTEMKTRAARLSNEQGVAVDASFRLFLDRLRVREPDESEWTYVRKDGSRLTVMLATTFLRNEQGEIDGCLGVATDITERTLAAAKIAQMAHYDHLTNLPNRRLFHDRIQMAMTQARREKLRMALMLIDLDRFKPINDGLGHAVGDLLLKAVAQRTQGCLRESDTLARVGGDEFVVLLPSVEVDHDAFAVAEKIRLALNQPFTLAGGYKVSIACSIGIALYPEHGRDEKTLMKSADDAMYVSKEQGRNCVYLAGGAPNGGKNVMAGGEESSVVRLVWHRWYRCGEASIDREHHELFDRANILINVLMAGEERPERVFEAFDELISCVTRHFSNEEAILSRYHFSDLEAHAVQHRELLRRALVLREQAARGKLALGDAVSFIAQDVVVRHLLGEDRKYFMPLKRALKHAAIEPETDSSDY